jgi:hypothetical protein
MAHKEEVRKGVDKLEGSSDIRWEVNGASRIRES